MLIPLYHALGTVLAFYYDHVLANYAGAIALLTLTVMALVAPLTIRSARWTTALQRLQPEMKKLQAKYNGDRARLNEELTALYRANGVSPIAGCLPSLIPLPVFYVLYRMIGGLTHTVRVHGSTLAAPENISHNTKLYRALVAGGGHMHALGIDLARSALAIHSPIGLAYWAIVGLVIVVQYLQSRQARSRSGSPAPDGSLVLLQRITPWTFVAISAIVAAAVNIYFLVSGIVRIAQTELMYRYDPMLAGRRWRGIRSRPQNVPRGKADAAQAADRPAGCRRETWNDARS